MRPTRTCLNAARARTVLTTPLREAVTRDLRAESLAITTPRKVAAIDVAGSANAIAAMTATASRRALFTLFVSFRPASRSETCATDRLDGSFTYVGGRAATALLLRRCIDHAGPRLAQSPSVE